MVIHGLSAAECDELLARTTIGRLGCARDNQPYVVLIPFSFDQSGRCLYSFATAGRKIDWMPSNPRVCLEVDEIADEFHQVEIAAPAAIALATATEMKLLSLPLVRAVIRTRELALGGRPDTRPHPEALLAQMLSIGWVVLAERPDEEIVLGAVTQPWHAAPLFRSIPAHDFAAFDEPGYVKIAWSLRAEPDGAQATRFHVETRVCTSDPDCRARFRRYWSYVAPGVALIRLAMLQPLKRETERRAAALRMAAAPAPDGTPSPAHRER